MTICKKIQCILYLAISISALVVCWKENLQYLPDQFQALEHFINDTMANPASRSITYDILFFFLSASIWMITESKKMGIKFVYGYIIFGAIIAISVTFPLFLIAREFKLASTND